MSLSRKSTRCKSYDQTDKVVFHWFVGKRSLKVPIDGIILKEKVLEFGKTLGIKEFKASDCWLNKWIKKYEYNNRFLFALFCTTLNIFTKNFHHFPWVLDLQLARNLHSIPVAKIDFFASYDNFGFYILVCSKKIKYHLSKFPVFTKR